MGPATRTQINIKKSMNNIIYSSLTDVSARKGKEVNNFNVWKIPSHLDSIIRQRTCNYA